MIVNMTMTAAQRCGDSEESELERDFISPPPGGIPSGNWPTNQSAALPEF